MVALRNAAEADEVRGQENAGLTQYDPRQDTDVSFGGKQVNKEKSQELLKQHLADKEGQTGGGQEKKFGDQMPHRLETEDKEGALERSRYLAIVANPAKGQRLRRLGTFFKEHRKGSAAGLALGVGMGVSVFFFGAIQPFKLVSIVNGLDNFYGGANGTLVEKMSDRLFSKYLSRYVLPGLAGARPRCHTTATPGCVGNITGSGPVARLYESWKQAHVEVSLAKRGVTFVRDGNNVYGYINGAKAIDADVMKAVISGKADLLRTDFKFLGKADSPETVRFLRATARAAYGDDEAFAAFKRFFAGRVAVSKYATIRCVFACKLYNPIKVTAQQAKNYAKAYIADKLITQNGSRMGTMVACLLVGTDQCSTTINKLKSNNVQPGDAQAPVDAAGPESTFGADMAAEAAAEGAEAAATDIAVSEAGVQLAQKAASSNVGVLGAVLAEILDAVLPNVSFDVALNAIPAIGTAISLTLIAAMVVSIADSANPALMHMTFITNTLMAVQLFMMYKTVTSEAENGSIDAGVLGSFTDTLNTNALGTADNQVDATTTPLYGAIFGDAPPTTNYKCDDGSSVPAGQLICPEEKMAQGNAILDAAHNAVNIFPAFAALAHIINGANNLIGTLLGHLGTGAFEAACHLQDSVPPGNSCTNATKALSAVFSKFTQWFITKIVASPFASNMSGGRIFDMMAAGADALSNTTAQTQLGAPKITDQQAADLRAEAINEQKEQFAQEPVFARLFSTTTQYSLVSQLALALPSTPEEASVQFMGIISNPLNALGSTLATIFSGTKLFAATQSYSDPFGIPQYGYLDSQIPDDPETYWAQHCDGRDFATEWENSQAEDPITGQPVATTPEPCMLIQAMTGSVGGALDPSLLPSDSLNPDPTQ